MRMYDLIEKKKQGRSLTGQELDWMIAGFTEGAIPDYQMAAFLMAVCFQGMSEQETTAMTLAMARSGGQALHRRRGGQDHPDRCADGRRLRHPHR